MGEPADLLAHSPVAPPIVELGRAADWHPLPLTVRDARRRARALDLGVPPVDRRGARRSGAADRPRADASSTAATSPCAASTSPCAAAGSPRSWGATGPGKSSLLWAVQGGGRRTGGTVDVGRRRPGRPRAAAAPRAGRAGPADRGRPALPRDRRRGVRRRRRRQPAPAATILDRLVPGDPRRPAPARPLRGSAAGAGAGDRAHQPRRGWCSSTSRPAGSTTPPKRALAGILRDLADDGHAVLVATHDVEFVAQVADDVVVLAEGEVVSSGPAREVVARVARPSPRRSPRCSARRGCGSTRSSAGLDRRPSAVNRAVALSPRSAAVLAVASVAGLMMLIWPLLLRVDEPTRVDPPFLFLALLPLVIAVVLAEVSEGGLDPRVLADPRRAQRGQRDPARHLAPAPAGSSWCSSC